MDDLEFRKRAHSDPFDDAADFTAAVASSPQRARLIQQLQSLDDEIGRVLQSVSVPDLAGHLKSMGSTDPVTDTEPANDLPPPALPARQPSTRRYFALAAGLVVAVTLGLSLNPASGPSAQDMEFHDNLVSHLYAEEPRYIQSAGISWQQISQAFSDAGGHLKDEASIRALPVRFAKTCIIEMKGRGAHIVLDGLKGPVSVFLLKGGSVSSEFQVKDERFAGRILPMGEGNLVIIGEKDESLDDYQRVISENFEWDA